MAHDNQIAKEPSPEEEKEQIERPRNTLELMEKKKSVQEKTIPKETESEKKLQASDGQFELPFEKMR